MDARPSTALLSIGVQQPQITKEMLIMVFVWVSFLKFLFFVKSYILCIKQNRIVVIVKTNKQTMQNTIR